MADTEMQEKQIKTLLDRYLKGECTPEEKLQVEVWYFQQASNSDWNLEEEEIEPARLRIYGKLNYRIDRKIKKTVKLWPRIAAAASVLLFLSVGGYFLYRNDVLLQTARNKVLQDLQPGSNKATLTLANGRKVSLTDAKNGIISKEGEHLIQKSKEGTLSYGGDALADKNQKLVYNTVTTPRGGQWSVKLSDGTKVMLDAASSITYPVSFAGNERKVTITGQAYFEVVHNAAKPFRVMVKGQLIEDIGTSFNIDAYDDEQASKVTLVEGSIKISKGDKIAFLTPGQQAVTADGINGINIQNVDIEEAVAWKNGLFYFAESDILSVMRELSRWYDVQIVYRGNIPKQQFNGGIQRSLKASQILEVLKDNYGIPFKIEGKQIIVGEN